jgi:hypothetical protein
VGGYLNNTVKKVFTVDITEENVGPSTSAFEAVRQMLTESF